MTREVSNDLTQRIDGYRIDDVLQKIKKDSFGLPSFQREFVWSLQQIIALFDSIMLEFPISTFIFWNVEEAPLSKNWFYPFFKRLAFKFNGHIYNTQPKVRDPIKNIPIAVLDGQQRLTGLFLALYGTVQRIPYRKQLKDADDVELYLDLGSGASFINDIGLAENEDNDYMDDHEHDSQTPLTSFKFRWDTKKPGENWFRIKDVHNLKDPNDRECEIDKILQNVEPKLRKKAKENLEILTRRLFDELHINASTLKRRGINTALEIFTRFNSGGTGLKKAELVFSAIESRWDEGKAVVDAYLSKLNNRHDNYNFSFDKMFLARLVLALFGDESSIKKTDINDAIVNELKENWTKIKKAIDITCKFLEVDAGITDDRMLSSYTSIIPIIYSIYNDGDVRDEKDIRKNKDIKKYIYRALMMNIFSRKSSTDLLWKLIKPMKAKKTKGNQIRIINIEEEINDFKVTPDKIQNIIDREKSFTTQLILFLIANTSDGLRVGDYEYNQDHIHAAALFDEDKPKGVSREDWARWGKMKNRLPNLRLLMEGANKLKSDKRLTKWLDTPAKKKKFIRDHGLPLNSSLEFEDFEKFYKSRETQLRTILKEMLL
jgi:uncharacterized protein with ParB-like and HNH nuclease domain